MYEIERKFLVDTDKWKPTGDGKKIKQGYSVKQGEPFAPVGDSGCGTGAHLHLALNNGADNPLVYLDHDASDFKVIMENPKDNAVLKQSDLTENFPVKFNVDASQGKDLDKINVALDGQSLTTFNYGGKPGEDKKLIVLVIELLKIGN